MRMNVLLLLAHAVLASVLSAADPVSPDPGGAEGATHDDLRFLFDKGKIAAEAYQRLVGLEESGRPHIPKGTVLEDAELDPRVAEVDPEALRQRTIALYESRAYDPSPLVPLPEGAAAAPVLDARPAREGRWFWKWLSAAGILAMGGLILLAPKLFAFRRPPEDPRASAGRRPEKVRRPSSRVPLA